MDENLELWENNTLEKAMKTNEELNNDTRKVDVQWALIGAMYGFLVGTAFVIVATFINVWLHPELPLGVEWGQALVRWLLIGLGLALTSALTSLFTETLHGLVAGTLTAGLLALASALYLSSTSAGIKFIVLIFILVPIAVTTLPIVLFLRRLTYQHTLALEVKRPALRITLLLLAAISLGALGGYFMKMSRSALLAVQVVQENIQASRGDPDSMVSQMPGFQKHSGMKYVLFQKPSTVSTEGFDIRAEYEDGYVIHCVVIVYPGHSPSLRSCEEIP